MRTADLTWVFEHVRYLRRAYELSVSLGLDPDFVVRELLPDALMLARKDFRSRSRGRRKAVREGRNPYTSFPNRGQTFQIAVMRLLPEVDHSQGPTPGWYVVRYCAALVAYTVPKSALYVGAGIGGVLGKGSPQRILQLYDVLSPSPGKKGVRQVRRVCAEVRAHLGATLGHLIRVEGGLPITSPARKRPDDEVASILSKLIPWDTEHVPRDDRDYLRMVNAQLGPDAMPSWDLTAAHGCIDQTCLRVACSWGTGLTGEFDEWLLPSPHPSLGVAAALPWRPPSVLSPAPSDAELLNAIYRRLRSGRSKPVIGRRSSQ
jgi:hypothetical protein